MPVASRLQVIERIVNPIAFNVYDQHNSANLLDTIAAVMPPGKGLGPNDPLPKEIHFAWMMFFPQMREWLGNRKIQTSFIDDLSAKVKKYEITTAFDTDTLKQRSGVDVVKHFSGEGMKGYALGKLDLAAELMASNPPTYDGADLFDDEHSHFDGRPGSNLLTVLWADYTQPTREEMVAALYAMRRMIVENMSLRERYVDRTNFPKLVIWSRLESFSQVLEELNTDEYLEEGKKKRNPFRGKLRIIDDLNPDPSLRTKLDCVLDVPGGPKPIMWKEVLKPTKFKFNRQNEFNAQTVDYGNDAAYSLVAAWWQACVRLVSSGGG